MPIQVMRRYVSDDERTQKTPHTFIGGTCGVRKMYRLFSRVVLDEDYYVSYISMDVPASTEYGGKKGYWYGIYESEYDEFNEIEEGELITCVIYISNAGRYCTDKRGYKIVDWMYEVLKDYME